ncbi:MAG: polyhydroxyalkanoate synthesis repressor PhaR [Myxococcota bacterium]|jgi:polyhydroxyalkanoate synthesis repressor PhaR
MRIIKKYSNRRLYDTEVSGYINLDGLAALIQAGTRVAVVDAKTGEDLTRSVLMQVLLEVQGGLELMPVGLLHRMIRMGASGPMVSVFSKQLSAGLELLDAQLSRVEEQFRWVQPDVAPSGEAGAPEPGAPEPEASPEAPEADAVDELKARLAALEERLKKS